MLSQRGGTIEGLDESDRAVEQDYASKDVWDELSAWRRERASTVELLRTLTDEDLAIAYLHTHAGPMRLGDMANMLACHDLYHIEQLTAYL